MSGPVFDLMSRGYGKEHVRSLTFRTGGPADTIADLTVTTMLRGGIEESYRSGDNGRMVTSDAQRNVALAAVERGFPAPVEVVALDVARSLHDRYPEFPEVEARVVAAAWFPAGRGFVREDPVCHRAEAVISAGSVGVVSGMGGLDLLVTTGSRFTGFRTDEMTTNRPVEDRPLAGTLDVSWSSGGGDRISWDATRAELRRSVLEAFSGVRSESVQHLLTTMGARVLESVPAVRRLSLRLESLSLTGVGRLEPEAPVTFAAGTLPVAVTEVTVSRSAVPA